MFEEVDEDILVAGGRDRHLGHGNRLVSQGGTSIGSQLLMNGKEDILFEVSDGCGLKKKRGNGEEVKGVDVLVNPQAPHRLKRAITSKKAALKRRRW